MCVCVHIHVYTYVYMYICAYTCVYTHVCVYAYTGMCICVCIYTCMCMCVCTHVCVCMCIYVHCVLSCFYIYIYSANICGASQVVLVVKNPSANAGDAGDPGSIPGSGRSPGEENGNPLQDSCLGNPMDRGAWRATVQKITESWT